MIYPHTYKNHEEYLQHQIKGRVHWFKRLVTLLYRRRRIDRFHHMFSNLHLPRETACLCIGARYGEEVVAGRRCFQRCIGIDLIPVPPLVEKGDMHQLHFADESFDLIYSNAIDHSVNPARAFAEMRRVLRLEGRLLIDSWILREQLPNQSNKYESVIYQSVDEIAQAAVLELVKQESIDPKGPDKVLFGVTDRLLFKKVPSECSEHDLCDQFSAVVGSPHGNPTACEQ